MEEDKIDGFIESIKSKEFTFDAVSKKLQVEELEIENADLKECYEGFQSQFGKYNSALQRFDGLINDFMPKRDSKDKPDAKIPDLINRTKNQINFHPPNRPSWTQKVAKEYYVKVVAHVFAIVACTKGQKVFQNVRNLDVQSAMTIPHVSQVISVFRMLGIGTRQY